VGELNELIFLAKSWHIERIDFVEDSTSYGHIYFDIAVIDISEDTTYEEKLATMCHELGHWFMYLLGIHSLLKFKEHRNWSEWWADFVGNLIRVFFVGRENLSDEEWRRFKGSIVRK
jgi:hypothetical protein